MTQRCPTVFSFLIPGIFTKRSLRRHNAPSWHPAAAGKERLSGRISSLLASHSSGGVCVCVCEINPLLLGGLGKVRGGSSLLFSQLFHLKHFSGNCRNVSCVLLVNSSPNVASNTQRRSTLMHLRKKSSRRRKLPAGRKFCLSCEFADLQTHGSSSADGFVHPCPPINVQTSGFCRNQKHSRVC